MGVVLELDSKKSPAHGSQLALLALNGLPDRCALDLGELARRIGVDKLDLITWARADLGLARLIEAKVAR